MNMSGDLNDYLFPFIALAVNTIKNHNGGNAFISICTFLWNRQSTVLIVKWERFINEIVIFAPYPV